MTGLIDGGSEVECARRVPGRLARTLGRVNVLTWMSMLPVCCPSSVKSHPR